MKKRSFLLLFVCLSLVVAAWAASEALPADNWKDTFPDQYNSYLKNADNKDTYSYVEAHPQIAVLYEGFGFAHSYFAARGHEYTLEDVKNIGRPHPLANCLTCKSGDYTAMVNKMGDAAYKIPFDEAFEQLAGGISCYNCHGNEPPTLQVTHGYLADAIKAEDNIAPDILACAQCHVEYYFPADTKATVLPYTGHENTTPEAIYNYFQEMDFADFVNPRTGTRMIKVQHPEFETYTGAGSVHASTYSCADCHMGKVKNEAGDTYSSHTLKSPLNSPEIVASCAGCHQDLSGMVAGIQEEIEKRTYEIADKLVVLTNALADKVTAGADDKELDPIRALNREAQFYWDFVFVENSEGAHNSRLSRQCLDKAEELTAQALELLGI